MEKIVYEHFNKGSKHKNTMQFIKLCMSAEWVCWAERIDRT